MDIGTSTSEFAGSETEGSEEKEGSEEAEGSGDSMSISASSIADGNKALKWFGSSSTQRGRSLLVRSMTALRIESCRCAATPGTYAISTGASSRVSMVTMVRASRLAKPCTCASFMNEELSKISVRLARLWPAHHSWLGPTVTAASDGRRLMTTSCVRCRSLSLCSRASLCASCEEPFSASRATMGHWGQ